MENKSAAAEKEILPSAAELEALCAAVPPAVERTRMSLEQQYYEQLAEEALGPKWQGGVPSQEAQALMERARGELERLHQTSKYLAQS